MTPIMTPGTCYKLEIFINEVLSDDNISGPVRDKTRHELTQLALQGDCQFNWRCRRWDDCPMAKQIRPKHCTRFWTKDPTAVYHRHISKQ